MNTRHPFLRTLTLVAMALTVGCAAPMSDYSAYRTHFPRSILVLPPLNDSVDVNAPYIYLSTITSPLAECGYYVFPVAVIDAFMKENGMPTPGEMHTAPLDKIREVIGADAVLYITIEDWGQKYRVVQSTTVVQARARLVDVGSGTTLWEGTARAVEGSGDAGAGLMGMLIMAAVEQVVDTLSTKAHTLAYQANSRMIFHERNGLPLGHYNPGYETDPRGR